MDRARLSEVTVGVGLGAAVGLLVERLDLASLVSWWGDRTYIVLAGAVLGGGVGAAPVRRWLAPGVLALLAAWALVAFTPVTLWLARDLVDSRPPVPADAVLPLASSVQADGDLTGTALARVVTALELVAAGHAPRLIITEIPPPFPRVAPAVRELMAGLGVEAEVIALGPVGNTHDEALAVAALAEERGFESVLLVSSPVHTRRAALTFEAAGVRVVPVAARETRYDLERLERPRDRIRAFGSVVHEWMGLAWYRWKGWID